MAAPDLALCVLKRLSERYLADRPILQEFGSQLTNKLLILNYLQSKWRWGIDRRERLVGSKGAPLSLCIPGIYCTLVLNLLGKNRELKIMYQGIAFPDT